MENAERKISTANLPHKSEFHCLLMAKQIVDATKISKPCARRPSFVTKVGMKKCIFDIASREIMVRLSSGQHAKIHISLAISFVTKNYAKTQITSNKEKG